MFVFFLMLIWIALTLSSSSIFFSSNLHASLHLYEQTTGPPHSVM
jgi:hypothetical protein